MFHSKELQRVSWVRNMARMGEKRRANRFLMGI
jgi:hypothetical protein